VVRPLLSWRAETRFVTAQAATTFLADAGVPAEPSTRTSLRRVPMWALTLGVWTLYAFILAVVLRSAAASGGAAIPSWIIPLAAAQGLAWWALTPAIAWLARTATTARIGRGSSLVVHAAGAVVTAAAMTAVRVWTREAAGGDGASLFAPAFVYWFDAHVLIYVTVVFVARALDLHRRYRDSMARTHLLELQLSRAQMQFLELQLQPHFLFNCLNAVSELAHEAPEAAERMLRQLHALLRVSLERAGQDEVTLDEELAGLAPYIEIQKTRFSDWLSVDTRIDPAARDALVPHLILQPLVENAIRHGLAVRSGPGRVEISAQVLTGTLRLTVKDDGVGLSPARMAARPGIGLRNARDRLRQLYDPDYRFVLRAGPDSGTVVELDVPLRRRERHGHDSERTTARDAAGRVADGATYATGLAREHNPSADAPHLALVGSDGGLMDRLGADPLDLPPGYDEGSALVTGGWASVRRPEPVAPPPPQPVVPRGPFTALGLTIKQWLGILAGWTVIGLFWSYQIVLIARYRPGVPVAPPSERMLNLIGAAVWAILTPVALLLAQRVRITRERFAERFAIHVLAAVGIGAMQIVLSAAFAPGVPVQSILPINPQQIVFNLFIYFFILTWSHARDFSAWYRERELADVRLETAIARSRYQALCVQLRPHFVLGTLDLLTGLVHEDVPRAERLITRLADVLRLTLDSAAEPDTTLRKELELLRAYVDVYQLGIRPGVRLVARSQPELLGATLPNRLLRTLADDVLGTYASDARVDIVVEAERFSGTTRVRVQAEGPATASRVGAAWPGSVEAAALAEADHSVSLLFPDARTAIVMLDDRPDGSPVRDFAFAARPA
jgi:two-component system, LytTR family, sensor kinase